jgi:alpha-L-arabinofuranosidase
MQEPIRTNGVSLYGWRPYGDHGMLSGHDTRYPHFHTFKLLRYFARGGDQTVRATSDNKLLAVYAARRTNGALTLLVINKSPSTPLTANFSLHNFEPGSKATLYSYGISQDEATHTGTGSQDIAESKIEGGGSTFSHQFPPYSVSVVELRR